MLLLLSLTASADVPPPPGYVETCTVDIQCGETTGTACSGWHGGREECEALEEKGWQRMCKTRGASTWSEVFCETTPDEEARQERISKATGVINRAKTVSARRCGCTAVSPAAAGLLLPLVALVWRRRR